MLHEQVLRVVEEEGFQSCNSLSLYLCRRIERRMMQNRTKEYT